MLLWLGLFGPLWINTDTLMAAESVTGGLGVEDALRAAIPATALLVAQTLTSSKWRKVGALEYILMIFVMYSALSMFWSISPRATLLKAIVLALQILVAFLLVRQYTTTSAALNAMSKATLAVVGSAILGIVIAPSRALVGAEAGALRLWGALPGIHPNSLAFVAAISILLLTTRHGFVRVRSGATRYAALGASWSVLYLTGTRYAFVLCVAVCLFIVWRGVRRTAHGDRPLLVVGAHFALASGLIGAWVLADRILFFLIRGQERSELASMTGRTDIWGQALTLFSERPMFGYGYYTGHRINLARLPGAETELSNLDNMWIETAVDTGLLGVLILFCAVGVGLVRTWRKTGLTHDSVSGLQAVLLFCLAASFMNPSIQSTSYGGALFTFVLLLSALPSADTASDCNASNLPEQPRHETDQKPAA